MRFFPAGRNGLGTAGRRRFALLLNRFRWEDAGGQQSAERVRAVLDDRGRAGRREPGIDRADPDLVLSILALDWAPGVDGTGRINAGSGRPTAPSPSIVEALEVTLRDVTQP